MKRALIFFSLYLISALAFGEELYPWDLLKDRKFREAYHAMLGRKINEKWLATLPGPSEPARKVTIASVEYLFIHSCKPHDCDSHNIVILYSPTSRRSYGKLVEQDATSKLGNSSPEISAALDRLYAEEFGTAN